MNDRAAQSYCTLFDKNYLVFGLALHQSLLDRAGPFTLYMLAMDEECERILVDLRLESVVVVSFHDVVTSAYEHLRERMSFGQLCWTCQPLLCAHVLTTFGADSVVYLEADSYFFDDPAVLLDEIAPFEVSLVPHRYSVGHDQSEVSGIYCVQFNRFGQDAESRLLLDDWTANCLKYDKHRRSYLPGQLCLDNWPSRSSAVHVVRHPGAGVAPWNVAGRVFSQQEGQAYVDDTRINFYHFHELAFVDRKSLYLSSYSFGPDVVNVVYLPYARALQGALNKAETVRPGFAFLKRFAVPTLGNVLAAPSRETLMQYLRHLKTRLTGRWAANLLRLG